MMAEWPPVAGRKTRQAGIPNLRKQGYKIVNSVQSPAVLLLLVVPTFIIHMKHNQKKEIKLFLFYEFVLVYLYESYHGI